MHSKQGNKSGTDGKENLAGKPNSCNLYHNIPTQRVHWILEKTV